MYIFPLILGLIHVYREGDDTVHSVPIKHFLKNSCFSVTFC